MIRVSRQPPLLLKTPLIRFEPPQGGSVHRPPLGWEPPLPFRSIGTYCLRCKEPDPVPKEPDPVPKRVAKVKLSGAEA
eukprot:4540786-Prymnesium_polylepis.1